MTGRLLYLDCSSGASGDMLLAGLVDVGVPFKKLEAELGKLRTGGFRLVRSKARRGGIRGTRIRVEAPGDRGHRYWSDFERIVDKSRLSAPVKERSLALLRRLFEAEAAVHGQPVEKIHLHELGALDTLVDVVGAVSGLELLEVEDVVSSPVNVGGGAVVTEHGRMSVPAPATALLLEGAPIFSDGDELERTTPTGALLVTGLARRFGPWPGMTLRSIGYGLGTADPASGRPNALRLALGDTSRRQTERLSVVETTVDDMTAEQIGFLQEKLREAGSGVLDVFLTPVQMKKNRPGINVTVLVRPVARDRVSAILFSESTTLGVRSHDVEREVLERRFVPVTTPFGKVRIKQALRGGKVVNLAPEFDDCRRAALSRNVPLKRVQEAALAAHRRRR